ncbi:MAG: S8 family serine peptidase [Candidatus Thorarchaeota archaeon]
MHKKLLTLGAIIMLFFALCFSEMEPYGTPIEEDDTDIQFSPTRTSRFSARFTRELTQAEIELLETQGLSFGDMPQHIGNVYILEGTENSFDILRQHHLFENAEPLRHYKNVLPRDVSLQETHADIAWNLRDYYGVNATGEGMLIADLDTGIQWYHPDFFYADGISTSWFDVNTNGIFDPGTDGTEFNGNPGIQADEVLHLIDVDNDGAYTTDIDWLWIDNGTNTGVLDRQDTIFVTADNDGDTILDTTESLVALQTPKTRYVVHNGSSGIEFWQRGVNLTSCTYEDTDGHGTSVAGILNGGQLGYHKYMGLAPKADLMAINIFGSDGLTVEEGLVWAKDHGATVILIEVGSWTYQYLDGSSNVERMIDELVSDGIPVIVPAGNLYGQNRHSKITATAGAYINPRFFVPSGTGATSIYITVLSTNSLQNPFAQLREPTAANYSDYLIFSFGDGYQNWERVVTGDNITVDTFKSVSSRGTNMLGFLINGTIMETQSWTLSVTTTLATTYQLYISDDQTGWGGGVQWQDGVTNNSTISWPSTADSAISVGAYSSRSYQTAYGIIAPFSSRGPRIDGKPKMSVTAPGDYDVVSSWSNESAWPSWVSQGQDGLPVYQVFGGNTMFSGTSAAGPHVAATAALMVQMNNRSGYLVKELIESTAYNDTYTGSLPKSPSSSDPRWGYGKLNACAAVEETLKLPLVSQVNYTPETPMYYHDVNFTLRALNTDYVQLAYSIDYWSSNTTLNMTKSGSQFNGRIPRLQYNTFVDFAVSAVNSSAILPFTETGSFLIGDDVPPIVYSVERNVTDVHESEVVEVKVNTTEPENASGILSVYLEYSSDDWSTKSQVSAILNSGYYVATIPGHSAGETVLYRFVVQDSAGETAQTSVDSYTVQASTTTTTTTDTSTTTTEATTTATTGTTTVTTEVPDIMDYLRDNIYLVGGIAILALIIIIYLVRRR